MTKRVLIHTGRGKTGSSAPQLRLTTHRSELLEAGMASTATGLAPTGLELTGGF